MTSPYYFFLGVTRMNASKAAEHVSVNLATFHLSREVSQVSPQMKLSAMILYFKHILLFKKTKG